MERHAPLRHIFWCVGLLGVCCGVLVACQEPAPPPPEPRSAPSAEEIAERLAEDPAFLKKVIVALEARHAQRLDAVRAETLPEAPPQTPRVLPPGQPTPAPVAPDPGPGQWSDNNPQTFRPSAGTAILTIDTTPTEAEIYGNGRLLGSSPLVVQVSTSRSLTLEIRKEGHSTHNTIFHPDRDQRLEFNLQPTTAVPSDLP